MIFSINFIISHLLFSASQERSRDVIFIHLFLLFLLFLTDDGNGSNNWVLVLGLGEQGQDIFFCIKTIYSVITTIILCLL